MAVLDRVSILDPALRLLWLRAQRQEVHINVASCVSGRGSAAVVSGQPEVLSASSGAEVLSRGLRLFPLFGQVFVSLHLEAGCGIDAVLRLQEAMEQADWQRAFDAIIGDRTSFRVTDKRCLVVKDQLRGRYVLYPLFEHMISTLKGVETETKGIIDALIHKMSGFATGENDWRKTDKRKELMRKLQDLQWGLTSFSMAISLNQQYMQSGGDTVVPLGMSRGRRWQEVLFYLTERAGELKSLAESYFQLDDLSNSRADTERAGIYVGILHGFSDLFEKISEWRNRLGALPLADKDLLRTAVETGSSDILFRSEALQSTNALGVTLLPGVALADVSNRGAALGFVGVEGGAALYGLPFLQDVLRGSINDGKLVFPEDRVVKIGRLGGGIIIRELEEDKPAPEIYYWRFKRLASRLEHFLLPLFQTQIESLTDDSSGKDNPMQEAIIGQMRQLYSRISDFAFLVKGYSSSPTAEFSGVKRVGKWRESLELMVAELAALKGLKSRFFDTVEPHDKAGDFMDFFYEALLAGRDYVAGSKMVEGGLAVRQILEHGRKTTFDELKMLFEEQFSGVVTLEMEVAEGLTEEEGVYLSPVCFLSVGESVAKVARDLGQTGQKVSIRFSVEGKNETRILVQIRMSNPIDPGLLESVPYVEEGRLSQDTQRLFVMTDAERESGDVNTGGWVIRDVVEYMQGKVRAFNDESEGVIEINLRRSA